MLQKFWKSTLVALCLASLVAALHPDIRTQIRALLLKDYRVVVSSTAADFASSGSSMEVVKVKTRNALFLEIYKSGADGSQKLVDRLELKDQNDGYFSFNGQATNLAIDDIDGDGRPEILAPSFDRDMVGHLNIYRYVPGRNHFEKVVL
jgi:hypothetical protein